MQNDPDEITNLAGHPEHKKVVSEHQEAIHGFLASLKKPAYDPVKAGGKKKNASFLR
jgi:hypothetical protein